MKKLKDLFNTLIELFYKYKAPILYIVFGGITTVINIGAYWLCFDVLGISNDMSNIIAWVAAVLVAYITNKIWVFESKSAKLKTLAFEVFSFFSCRALTGVLDLAIMHVAVDMLHYPGVLFKVISNIIVIILNYVASKLFIFKKGSEK